MPIGDFYTPFKGRFVPADDTAAIGSPDKPVNAITARTVTATTFIGDVIGDVTGATTRLYQNTTTVGNTASASEEDLHTYTLPAATLEDDGDAIVIRSWIQCLANANAKRVRVYFGGTLIGDSTSAAFNNVGFVIEAVVFRIGASTQKAICSALQPNVDVTWGTAAGGGFNPTAPAETLAGSVLIRVTGQSAVSDANAVQALITTVDFIPGA